MSDLERAKKALNIMDVHLINSAIKVLEGLDLTTFEQEKVSTQAYRKTLTINETELSGDFKIWVYSYTYRAGIRLVMDDVPEGEVVETDQTVEATSTAAATPIVEIVASFRAKYAAAVQLNSDELNAFFEDNVGYHVWPYWREYVQSTCSRLGLTPSLNVPFYHVPNKEIDLDQPNRLVSEPANL